MGADVLRTNIIAKLERSCFVSSAVLVAPTTPSRKTLIFHSFITEILYLSSIALAAKTYVKPVSDSVSWEKGWL